MTTRVILLSGLAILALGLSGCDTADSGSSSSTTAVYYGVGFYDPWYYHGDYDDHHDHDVVINPPPRPSRPIDSGGERPSQPIARPPSGGGSADRVSARPTPSIPSTPRPAARGGRGR